MTIWIVALGVLAVIIGMLKVKGKCSVSSLKKDTREEDIYEPWKRLAQKYPDIVEAYQKVGLIDHEYKQDEAKDHCVSMGEVIGRSVGGKVDEPNDKIFKHLDAASGELSNEINNEEMERLLVTNPDASIFYQKGKDKFLRTEKVGVAKMCCWIEEAATINRDADAKAEEPKKKPKPRARKPRKNKKTQGKS